MRFTTKPSRTLPSSTTNCLASTLFSPTAFVLSSCPSLVSEGAPSSPKCTPFPVIKVHPVATPTIPKIMINIATSIATVFLPGFCLMKYQIMVNAISPSMKRLPYLINPGISISLCSCFRTISPNCAPPTLATNCSQRL